MHADCEQARIVRIMSQNPLHSRKKRQNLAVLLALAAFVLTVYFVTVVRLGAP
jgi:hypothetical protein